MVGATRLASLPVAGAPARRRLRCAAEVLRAERRRDPDRQPLLVVVTDGRSTHGPDPLPVARALARPAPPPGPAAPWPVVARAGAAAAALTSVVVDCETGYTRLGLPARLAEALGAVTVPLATLPAQPAGRRTAGQKAAGRTAAGQKAAGRTAAGRKPTSGEPYRESARAAGTVPDDGLDHPATPRPAAADRPHRDGKGKSTAAFGLACAPGAGLADRVFQFVKSAKWRSARRRPCARWLRPATAGR
jgi:hypothetical protein